MSVVLPMHPPSFWVDEIVARSHAVRDELARDPVVGPYIDISLPIPRPYLGSGPIRLVIIGQDPTVANIGSRSHISTVLNLDRNGSLKTFLSTLCSDLGLSLEQNVYATNAAKCFFVKRPTEIREVNVLAASSPAWLPLLAQELAMFPQAILVSLGQPVLCMLVRPGGRSDMKHYWGYHKRWRDGVLLPLAAIEHAASSVGRQIHPFVHEPTQRGARAAFYRARRPAFVRFIRESMLEIAE